MFEQLVHRYEASITTEIPIEVPAGTYWIGEWRDGVAGIRPDTEMQFSSGGDSCFVWRPVSNASQEFDIIGSCGVYPIDITEHIDEGDECDSTGVIVVVPETVTGTVLKRTDDSCGYYHFHIPGVGRLNLYLDTYLEDVIEFFKENDDWSIVKTKEEVDFIFDQCGDSFYFDNDDETIDDYRKEVYEIVGVQQ